MKKFFIALLTVTMLFTACDDTITFETATASIEEELRNLEDYSYKSQNYGMENFKDVNTEAVIFANIYTITANDGDLGKLSSITVVEVENKDTLKEVEKFFDNDEINDSVCISDHIIISSKGEAANKIVKELCN